MDVSNVMNGLQGSISTAGADIESNLDIGGGGMDPGKYIGLIYKMGQYSASVSASAGVASSISGALQSAASKVGS
jgi:hypothetical protein